MKKPPGISKEQWGEYQRVIKLSLDVASRSLDAIAEANFQAGQITERYRIIKLLEPLTKHNEGCYYKRQLACGLGDCSAWDYAYAVALIKGEISE